MKPVDGRDANGHEKGVRSTIRSESASRTQIWAKCPAPRKPPDLLWFLKQPPYAGRGPSSRTSQSQPSPAQPCRPAVCRFLGVGERRCATSTLRLNQFVRTGNREQAGMRQSDIGCSANQRPAIAKPKTLFGFLVSGGFFGGVCGSPICTVEPSDINLAADLAETKQPTTASILGELNRLASLSLA